MSSGINTLILATKPMCTSQGFGVYDMENKNKKETATSKSI